MLIKFAIQTFLEDRELKNLSQVSIKNYEITLKDFQKFCAENNILNVDEVTTSIIRSYLVYCQKEKKNKPATIAHKVRDLKAFFNFLAEEGFIKSDKNPCKKIEQPKVETKIPVFKPDHIRRIFAYFKHMKRKEKTFYAYRNYVIVKTLLGTGIRVGELINIKWADVDLVNNIITIFGKSREHQTVPIAKKLKEELLEYKAYCEKVFGKLPEYVFCTKDGQQLTRNAITCMFKRVKQNLGINDVRLSAHTFRYTFAHDMLMNGADAITLQELLRHKDPSMTRKYASMWGKSLAEQNEKYNPLNRNYGDL